MKRPIRVFVLLFLLGLMAFAMSLPENFRIQRSLLGQQVDVTVNPLTIDVTLFGTRIYRSFTTRLGLDLAGGSHVVLEADMRAITEADRLQALESAKEVIDRRVNFFGVSEPVVQTARTQDAYRIIVELPGITNTEEAVSLIGQTAMLEFREFANEEDATSSGFVIPMLDTTVPTGLSGADLKRAAVNFSQNTGEPEVAIEFTGEGAKKFSELTSRMVGKPLAIFLDEYPVTWPRVSVPITDGQAVITGSFSLDEAKTLALQLNAGALPVPVTVVENRSVGATLGQDSIRASVRAGVVGLSVVGLYMIALYGGLGVIAVMALIMYGLLAFAVFRAIPITLTLPGIAGFFLSVGMAVDANILIFERYKEERRKGKQWRMAMENGFGKAWDSIRDANVTTIVTALILYNPGNWQFLPSSGMVRGFAATLLIGVLISLFTGIVVTRTYIRMFYRPKGEKV